MLTFAYISGHYLKVVTDAKDCYEIFEQFHNIPCGGHHGMNRTVRLIKQRVFWPGMSGHVMQWVRTIHCCKLIMYLPLAQTKWFDSISSQIDD